MSGAEVLEDLGEPFSPDPSEARALARDKGFTQIWQGGMLTGRHLVLKLQISFNKKGRLLYNGRPYNRDSWTWRSPKFIRLQGREAKEEPNSYNNHPEIYLTTLNGQELRLDACPCGGELLRDRCEYLYCRECGMVY